uniref:Uncharacterized protein n=1 Tax=Ditylum brightwellii TaxID=49249 RepID=A0A7S2E4U4_9STRA|mmetsp:Transcript_13206/g.19709  ORF Transcript_13206/g.19709 Transcript_13206/m.19709 type:complete len:590 (+) Transcript_13206:76-1845(+)
MAEETKEELPSADISEDEEEVEEEVEAEETTTNVAEEEAKEETKEETKEEAEKPSPPPATKSGGGGRKNRRDEKPIEELFDLSKPIKRVERPSKEKHEETLTAIGDEIEKLKADRRKVQDKVEKLMGNSKNSEVGKEREAMFALRRKKGALIEEKKAIRERLDVTRAKADKISNDRKSARSTMRYSNLDDIEKEIQKLQRKQETTSMSLSDEKRIIKEMDALQASKKTVAEIRSKETDLEDTKEQRKAITAELNKKDKEIDAVQKEIEQKEKKLDTLKDKQSNSKETLQKLFDERDAIKKAMDEKHKERNVCRQKFREANNEWYTVQRALKAQRQMQYEEEKKKREEEKAAWLKKKEEEELKKIPYEEEMALCDYLADYLTRTYLTDSKEEKQKAEEEALKKKNADVVSVSEDPFANFKPMNKRSEDTYFSTGKNSKNSKKKGKNRQGKKVKAAPFILNVDSFEQFGLLNLTPPTCVENVEASVAELKAKKKWYSEQPRGSVPTAADIRKANEKAAGKIRQPNGSGKKNGGSSSKKFALADDDFAPLGGVTATPTLNSTWGQKPNGESADTTDIAEEEPTQENEAVSAE